MTDDDKWIWAVAIVLIGIFLFWAWSDAEAVKTGNALPKDATNIVAVGNGWYEFTYKNQRFLYHHYKVGNDMAECITAIEAK